MAEGNEQDTTSTDLSLSVSAEIIIIEGIKDINVTEGNKDINVLIGGESGPGKNELCYRLKILSRGSEAQTINKCTRYGRTINFIDTPNRVPLAFLWPNKNKDIDLLVYCIDVKIAGHREWDITSMKWLQRAYTTEIWKRCIFVFTFSKLVWSDCGRDSKYIQIIRQLAAKFQEELRKLTPETLVIKTIFDADPSDPNVIIAIPAGLGSDDLVLPGVIRHDKNEGWIGEIFSEIHRKYTHVSKLQPLKVQNRTRTLRESILLAVPIIGVGIEMGKEALWAHRAQTTISFSGNDDLKFSKGLIKNIEKAVSKNGKLDRKLANAMFIGPTGSGKTSLMYRLTSRQREENSSTGISGSVLTVNIDCTDPSTFHSVIAKADSSWEEQDYDVSLVNQLEADIDTTELKVEYDEEKISFAASGNTSSISSKPSRSQDHPTSAAKFQKKDTISKMIDSATTKCDDYTEFKKLLLKNSSLYLRDAGGQVEFQETVSLIVFGPSIFVFVFRVDLGFDTKYTVEYRMSDTKSINSYTSSVTIEEELLQSLASVYAMDTTAEVDTYKPIVIIVGTHKDKLGPSADERIKDLNERLFSLVVDNGFKDLVYVADQPKQQIMFTVDNTAQSEEDFKTIRTEIQCLVSKDSRFTIEYPVSYLFFCYELQNIKKSVLSLDEFRILASEFGITGDQVTHLLQFLHLRIGVIQYYDIEGVRHVVFKEPHVLFNKVTDLIINTFSHKGATVGENDDLQKGILSRSVFNSIIGKKDSIPQEVFLKLLIHLRIITPFPKPGSNEERYFIPCVLNHVPVSLKDHQLETDVMPLAVTFKCKHCPKGLFGVLITHLMTPDPDTSDPTTTTFTLIQEKLSKDQVSFKVHSTGVIDEISMKFHSAYINVKFYPELSPDRDTPKKAACNKIRQLILSSIRKAVKNLHYNQANVEPVACLHCKDCGNLHPVTKGATHYKMHCEKTNRTCRIPSLGRFWYNEDCDPHPSQGSSTESTDGALLPDDLPQVTRWLRQCLNDDLENLGIELGLYYPHLKRMPQVSMCNDMVFAWLRRDDNVIQTSGIPSWKSLATALEVIGMNGIAADIKEQYQFH